MALTVQEESSSSSSTSNSIPPWKFHVFLSFRGEDTRRGFTDHLYAALGRKGIITFRDDEELERGEVISQKLLKAIEESLFAIVVLSKNYASSSWCLDGLQMILDSQNKLGRQVFPIFYGVDPSDVRHQKGSFAEAFTKHEEKFREDQEKVRKWRDSLTEVANLSGWDSKDWRSRLWCEEDINQVLERNMGNETVQAMVIQPLSATYTSNWHPEALSNMSNLRLLIIFDYLFLMNALKGLSPGLKVLHWARYPHKALPLSTQLDGLVHLGLGHNYLKKLWSGILRLENLKFMNLSFSMYLTKTPNFSGVPNLEGLYLSRCYALVEVHPSLGQLKKLLKVDLRSCPKLKALPKKLEMNSLEVLVLGGCSKVRKLPEFGESMKNLTMLDLENVAIKKLPTSIGFLTGLEELNLRRCFSLVCLPHTIHNLKNLKLVDISYCSRLQRPCFPIESFLYHSLVDGDPYNANDE